MPSRTIAWSLWLLLACGAAAQTSTVRPAFEVVDIKVDTSGAIAPQKERLLPGGRIELNGATVKEMIAAIYGVKGGMIAGGPPWMGSERFDIVAKAAPDTNVPVLLEMVKTMLAEQFHLVFHHEEKVMAVYALTVAKDGPRLKEAPGGRQNCSSHGAQINGVPVLHSECVNISMPEFARQLGLNELRDDDRPVVDLTRLDGAYDLVFEFGRPQRGGQGDGAAGAELTGPTIFEALAKIGLKLEASKQPVAAMVIDRVERPPDN